VSDPILAVSVELINLSKKGLSIFDFPELFGPFLLYYRLIKDCVLFHEWYIFLYDTVELW
jgi:hypothetical protein